MIDYETYSKIKFYAERDGLNIQQIADKMGLNWRTVEKCLNKPRFEQRKSSPKPSKLDVYKDHIQQLLEKHDYTAKQILQQIRVQGYSGGYTIVKDYYLVI